jgi:hypothetical protein
MDKHKQGLRQRRQNRKRRVGKLNWNDLNPAPLKAPKTLEVIEEVLSESSHNQW